MISRFVAVLPVTLFAVLIQLTFVNLGSAAQYRTRNFVVRAADPAFAKQVGEHAEKFRKELAELWLGEALPDWPRPCPITVVIEMHAGGETSFAFAPGPDGTSQPFDWRMKIYGPPERLLDSVLPHEVTHTIFATYYGRPLPRWADEGACTTVEHASERKKNHQMLLEFLTTSRGIPFNHMFAMKQYPSDILPLYAQGYSLARYLIMQKGHRHFVNFVGEGMQREVPGREPQTWNDVGKKYYGYEHLSDLQIQWLAWVKKGCPDLKLSNNPALTAVAQNSPAQPSQPVSQPRSNGSPVAAGNATGTLAAAESWYVRQSQLGGNSTMQRPAADANLQNQSHQYSPGSIREVTGPPPSIPDLNATKWR